jgi:hypothetical protein
MSPLKINRHSGSPTEGVNGMVALLAKDIARLKLAALTDLTDNSAGTVSTTRTLTVPAVRVNIADVATSSAGKTNSEAALATLLNAIREVAAQTNTFSTALGLPTFIYSGGGASTDLTIAAITKSITASTTGVPAATVNTVFTAYSNAIYQVALRVNALAKAAGVPLLNLTAYKGTASASTVAALATSLGTAADPGVSKAGFDAEMTKFADNIATIAATLNTISTNAALNIVAQ